MYRFPQAVSAMRLYVTGMGAQASRVPCLQSRTMSAGPAVVANISLGTNIVQKIQVAFKGTVSAQQIASSLGFNWPFAVDVLTLTNSSLTYSAQPFLLAIDSAMSLPMLSFNSSATLIIAGKNNVSLAVSTWDESQKWPLHLVGRYWMLIAALFAPHAGVVTSSDCPRFDAEPLEQEIWLVFTACKQQLHGFCRCTRCGQEWRYGNDTLALFGLTATAHALLGLQYLDPAHPL